MMPNRLDLQDVVSCSYLVIHFNPTENQLWKQLDKKYRKAYLHYNDRIYYLNRDKEECKEVPIKKLKLDDIKQLLKLENAGSCIEVMSSEQLKSFCEAIDHYPNWASKVIMLQTKS